MNPRHVVLLTYGEPPRPGVLAQLRYSWRILLRLTRSVARIPGFLLPALALNRTALRVSSWRRECFESPLEPITHAQAEGLAAALTAAAPGVGWVVHVAYEFRRPLLLDCLAALPPGEPVDVVPMYAVDSAFTHQLARDMLGRETSPGRAPVRVLPQLPIEVQAELAARHVRRELRRRRIETGKELALVLAAHGTLVDPPHPYETGRVETERLAREISRRLQTEFGTIVLGWLNHSFGGRWTEPAAADALRRVSEGGFRRVIYFPFGFFADNAETLLEGRWALRGEPRLAATHLPCWNDSPDFLAALADHIVAASTERRRIPSRRLDQVDPGEQGVIVDLDGDSGFERRLMELGLVPGTPIEVVRRAPFGDPVEIRIRDLSLSLRRTETRRVHVAPR